MRVAQGSVFPSSPGPGVPVLRDGHPEERGQQPAQEQRLQLVRVQHGLSSKSQQWALSHESCVHSSD